MYVIKDPQLVPQIVNNQDHFEKLAASPTSPFGRYLSFAITGSGDHPIRWRVAKGLMRTVVSHAYAEETVQAMKQQVLVSAQQLWSKKNGQAIPLYPDMLGIAVPASFRVLFGCDLSAELAKHNVDFETFIRHIDMTANTDMLVLEYDHKVDQTLQIVSKIGQAALRHAPEGTFGHRIQSLVQNTCCDDEASEFTSEMGLHNALFYSIAMPTVLSVVLHWTVLSIIRHPEYLHDIRKGLQQDDPTHFLMFLKEVLRMYPPVSSYGQRMVKRNVSLGGTRLTRGSHVLVVPAFLVGDQDFCPERWKDNLNLSNAIYGDKGDSSLFYAPFSSGSRGCIGRFIMAPLLQEVVSAFLQNFDFGLCGEDPWVGKPSALQHFPDNLITFKPDVNLAFTVVART